MSSADRLARPVTLPPGLARLVARPFSVGSPQEPQTMGMSPVACFAARATNGCPDEDDVDLLPDELV